MAPLAVELFGGLRPPEWLAALDDADLVGRGAGATPPVVVGTRLYLRRYWQYEQDLRTAIDALCGVEAVQAGLPGDRLRAVLDILFPPNEEGGHQLAESRLCACSAQRIRRRHRRSGNARRRLGGAPARTAPGPRARRAGAGRWRER